MRSVIKGGGDLLVENKENVKNSLEQYRVYSVIGPRTTLRAELDHDGNTFITEPHRYPSKLKSLLNPRSL